MLLWESDKLVRSCDSITRRDFLRVGALTAGSVGLSLANLGQLQQAGAAARASDINCIILLLVGGPSHLDTWDLKPAAPDNIRGPFKPIRTIVPGIEICEHFPLMAQMVDHIALVRSVHHQEAPIHETGHQLMQTGHLFRCGLEYPHYGSVVSYLRGPKPGGPPPFAVLPFWVDNTGVSVDHGQRAGYLNAEHEPCLVRGNRDGSEGDALGSRYGMNTFGQACLLARRLVEQGVRLVTVNMFDTVFNQVTWDCHADGSALAATLDDYKETLCPMFDLAYTALLEDLRQRGMLAKTMVVAMGEFGRTPRLNPRGGRDHWPGCWTILFAGAGVRGGQVIGASDQIGAEPKDRPVSPAEVAATIYKGLGIDLDTRLPGPESRPMPLVEAKPIDELF